MTTRLTTIFSTGTPGAALGALKAAEELHLEIGGHTAATDLPPDLAGKLRHTLAPRMAARLNVQDSDGTLILSFDHRLKPGSPAAYADEAVEQQRKASLHIVLPDGGRSAIPEDVRKGVLAWIIEERIATLHVTGPRERDEPGIQQAVHDALVWIFEDEVSGTVAPGEPAACEPEVSTPAGQTADASLQVVPPATLPQVAAQPEEAFTAPRGAPFTVDEWHAPPTSRPFAAPPPVPPEVWAERIIADCHPFQRDAVEDPSRRISILGGRGGATYGTGLATYAAEANVPAFYVHRLDVCHCGRRRGDHEGSQPQPCPETGCAAFVLAKAHDPRARPLERPTADDEA